MIKLHGKNTSNKNVYFFTHICFFLNQMYIKPTLKKTKDLTLKKKKNAINEITTCSDINKKLHYYGT